jgi:hypothetical protein
MLITSRSLAIVLLAGLTATALFGCAKAASVASSSHPPAAKQPGVPATAVAAENAMVSTVSAAKSVHVSGRYTWPSSHVRLNADLQISGAMAGSVTDGRLPMRLVDVAGKLYTKLTPAFLGYYGKSGECARLCGRYAVAKSAFAASLLRSIGMTSTVKVLTSAGGAFTNLTRTSYQGQPALRATLDTTYYPKAAYIVMSATPQCFPLLVVDPGHFLLTFTRWNGVPAPAAPPRRLVQTGPW